MPYILYTKTRTIIVPIMPIDMMYISGTPVILTPTEFRFLAGLLSNNLVKYDKLAEFVLGSKSLLKYTKYLSLLCHKIKKKTGLNIENYKKFGYTLRNEVDII